MRSQYKNTVQENTYQTFRFYLKESIINNQGRLENKNLKIRILFIHRIESKP